jgi:hypothetical protein
VSPDGFPPFLTPGAAATYWRALALAVSDAIDTAPFEDDAPISFEAAVQLTTAVAQSERALKVVEGIGPDVEPQEKLTQLLAWLLHDRVEVLDEAIARALAPQAARPAPHPALALLLRTRSILGH